LLLTKQKKLGFELIVKDSLKVQKNGLEKHMRKIVYSSKKDSKKQKNKIKLTQEVLDIINSSNYEDKSITEDNHGLFIYLLFFSRESHRH